MVFQMRTKDPSTSLTQQQSALVNARTRARLHRAVVALNPVMHWRKDKKDFVSGLMILAVSCAFFALTSSELR